MKAAIICGSRDQGYTSEMCRSFSKGLAVHSITSAIFFPLKMEIGHCSGCGCCSESGTCCISDEMGLLYKAFRECDLFVLASPIHFSGPSSSIKVVIDRFQPFWSVEGKHPRFSAALLSGGSPSPRFANAVSEFKAFSAGTKMECLGSLEIPGTDSMDISDVAEPSFDFAKEIGMKIKDRR